jgi:hypothetical protein
MMNATRAFQWLHRLRTSQPLFTPDTMPYWLALNCIGGVYCGYQMMEHRQKERVRFGVVAVGGGVVVLVY